MKPRTKRVYYVNDVKVTDWGRADMRIEWAGIIILGWFLYVAYSVLNLVAIDGEWHELEKRTVKLERQIKEFDQKIPELAWLDNQLN